MSAAVRSITRVQINAVGAMPRDRKTLGRQCLRRGALEVIRNGGGVLGGVECDDLDDDDLDEILPRELWWRRHHDDAHGDGVLMAGTRDRTRCHAARWLDGAPASPVNDPRPILRARIEVDETWSYTDATMHFPRSQGGEAARGVMIRRSTKIGTDAFGCDGNLGHAAMVARYPDLTVRSAEVMHIAADLRLIVGEVHTFDLVRGTTNDDHPGIRCSIRPRKATR